MIKSDNLIPLMGGAYQSRSKIADYEVCENLFPEINPETNESPTPVTHYPREGKRALGAPPTPGVGRGIFTLSNGLLYGVVGQTVYYIDNAWHYNAIGALGDILSTPVSISDNGQEAVLVDGSSNGYQWQLSSGAFSQIVDGTGTFVGSPRVDYADTFLVFAKPNSNEWYLTNSNSVVFNGLAVASKSSTPDQISTLAFNLRQLWLIGTGQGSEIWFNAGSTPVPYQEWPNLFVPYGCAAKYSLVRADIHLFWLSTNPQGEALALMTEGYGVVAISTRALEYEWSQYTTIADAIGGTFQQAGHTFIVFHFPTANKSWAYDLATKQWHRRTWIDSNGVENRENVAFYASVGVIGAAGGYAPTIVGQDWATGQIYALDPKTYTDNGQPIVCRRTFPHVMKDMKEITHVSFVADFETGGITIAGNPGGRSDPWSSGWSPAWGPIVITPPSSGDGDPIALAMRYSNNGGASFHNYRLKGLVTTGYYRSMMRFRGLGMARDRVYELTWSFPGPSALQGAYVEAIGHSA